MRRLFTVENRRNRRWTALLGLVVPLALLLSVVVGAPRAVADEVVQHQLVDSGIDVVDETFPLPTLTSEYKAGDATRVVFSIQIARQINTPAGWEATDGTGKAFKAEFSVSSDVEDMKTLLMTDVDGKLSKPLTFMPDPNWIDVSKLDYIKSGDGWLYDRAIRLKKLANYTITGNGAGLAMPWISLDLTVKSEEYVPVRIVDLAMERVGAVISVNKDNHLRLELVGENVLKSLQGEEKAAVEVKSGAFLDVVGDGSLVATGGPNSPGIGYNGWFGESFGTLIFSGGRVTGIGTGDASGIGAGTRVENGDIYIRGGVVEGIPGSGSRALDRSFGAGASASKRCSLGRMVFSGGEVIAKNICFDTQVVDGPVKINNDQYRRVGTSDAEVTNKCARCDGVAKVNDTVNVQTSVRAQSGQRVVFDVGPSGPVLQPGGGAWSRSFTMPDQDVAIKAEAVDWNPVLGEEYLLRYDPDTKITRVIPVSGFKIKESTTKEPVDYLDYPDADGIQFYVYNPQADETSKSVSIAKSSGPTLLTATFTMRTPPVDSDDVLVVMTASADIEAPSGWNSDSGSKRVFAKTVERDSEVSVAARDSVGNTKSYQFIADPSLIDLENAAVVGGDGWRIGDPGTDAFMYGIETDGNYVLSGQRQFEDTGFDNILSVGKNLNDVTISMNGVQIVGKGVPIAVETGSSVTLVVAEQNSLETAAVEGIDLSPNTRLVVKGGPDAELAIASAAGVAIGSNQTIRKPGPGDPDPGKGFVLSIVGATVSATGGTNGVNTNSWASGKAVDIGGTDATILIGEVHLSGGGKLLLNSGGTNTQVFVDGPAAISGGAAGAMAGVYSPVGVVNGSVTAMSAQQLGVVVAPGIWKSGTHLSVTAEAAPSGSKFTGFSADVPGLVLGERGSGSPAAWRTQSLTMPTTAVTLTAGYQEWIPEDGFDYTSSASPSSSDFVVSAATGYEIKRTADTSFGSSLRETAATANGTVEFALRHPGRDEVSKPKTIGYVIDPGTDKVVVIDSGRSKSLPPTGSDSEGVPFRLLPLLVLAAGALATRKLCCHAG
jgi:hypothetical protein